MGAGQPRWTKSTENRAASDPASRRAQLLQIPYTAELCRSVCSAQRRRGRPNRCERRITGGAPRTCRSSANDRLNRLRNDPQCPDRARMFRRNDDCALGYARAPRAAPLRFDRRAAKRWRAGATPLRCDRRAAKLWRAGATPLRFDRRAAKLLAGGATPLRCDRRAAKLLAGGATPLRCDRRAAKLLAGGATPLRCDRRRRSFWRNRRVRDGAGNCSATG